jgi:hypothetical protein
MGYKRGENQVRAKKEKVFVAGSLRGLYSAHHPH